MGEGRTHGSSQRAEGQRENEGEKGGGFGEMHPGKRVDKAESRKERCVEEKKKSRLARLRRRRDWKLERVWQSSQSRKASKADRCAKEKKWNEERIDR